MGLAVFPDDGRHAELSIDGTMSTRPTDPEYILETLRSLWKIDCTLDPASEVALHLVGAAILEGSGKAAFLSCYLALEQLIERKPRNRPAIELIDRFRKQVDKAARRKGTPISEGERSSLSAALKNLHKESFKGALLRFAARIAEPKSIQDLPLKRFLTQCVDTRNRIAHGGDVDEASLPGMTSGLRQFVLGSIWSRNRLPRLEVKRSPVLAEVPSFNIRLF